MEYTALYAFLPGVKNRDIGYLVLNTDPQNLADALKWVQTREFHFQVLYNRNKEVLANPKSKLKLHGKIRTAAARRKK